MTTPTTTPNDYSNVPLEMTQLVTITSVLEGTQETPVGTQRSFIGQIVPMPNTAAWTQYPYTFKYPAALPIEPKNGQQAWCRVKRENIKAGKDGSRAFDFWWGLTAFDVEAPQPGQETIMGSTPKEQTTNGTTTYSTNQLFGTPSSSTSSWAKSKDEQIAWNSAINNANSVMVTRTNREGKLLEYDDYYEGELAYMSHKFYLLIRNGPDFDKYGSLLDIEEPTVTEAPEQPVVEHAPAEQPVVEQAVQATLEPATDGLPGGSARE